MTKFHDPDDEPEGIFFEDTFENEEHKIDQWKGNLGMTKAFFSINYIHTLI